MKKKAVKENKQRLSKKIQKTDGSCPILEFSAGARTGNVKKIKKRCFLLQKPVQKKISGVFVLRSIWFFPVGHYWAMLQEDA